MAKKYSAGRRGKTDRKIKRLALGRANESDAKKAARKLAEYLKSPLGQRRSKEIYNETEQKLEKIHQSQRIDPSMLSVPKSI